MGRKLQVAFVLFEGVAVVDVAAPYQCLQLLPNIETVFVAHKVGSYIDAFGHLSINATHTFQEITHPDIVVIPGGPGIEKVVKDQAVLDWVQEVEINALYTTSVGTGALLLAAAGLLKGIEATTHWITHGALEKQGIKVTHDRVVQQGKIITSSGPTSSIEMGLKLAALVTSEEFARSVQLIVDYEPTEEGVCRAKAEPEVVAKAETLLYANLIRASNH